MKKYISALLALVMLLIPLAPFAAGDPRLDMRTGDDLTPKAETKYFTRYTPWLKVLHLTSDTETTHGGEGCQQIRCIDISPVDNDLAIFGTDTSGVWITTTGGDLWYNTNRNIIPTDIADVFCHPTDKNIMLCYTVGKSAGVAAPGIYRSIDMGRSWTHVYTDYISSNGTETKGASFTDNLFAYDKNGNIYAVTGKGVIKSTDNGATWSVLKAATETSGASNHIYATSIDVSSDGQTIIACYAHDGFSLNGINISTDGGATWSKLYISGTTDWKTYSFAMTDDGKYIAGAYDDTNKKYGLYISSNNETSWTAFANGESSYDKVRNNNPVVRLRLSSSHLYASYDSADANCRRLALTELVNVTFTDKWETLGMENVGTDTYRGGVKMFYSQGIDIQGDTMYICTAGPNKSTDGGTTWQRKSSGFSGVLVNHFDMNSDGRIVIARTDDNITVSNGNYTRDNTPTFTPGTEFSSTVATMVAADPNDTTGNRIICWYGKSNAEKITRGIIVTNDAGKTYETANGTGTTTITDSTFKVKDPRDRDTVLLEYDKTDKTNQTIYSSCATSTDNGKTWTNNRHYYLDVSGDKIIAWDIYGDGESRNGTNADGTACSYNLMYSADKGASWKSVVNFTSSDPFDIFFDAEDSNKLWYRKTNEFGTINISSKKMTPYKGSDARSAYSTLAQNPKHPNHLLLTSKALYEGYYPSLYESCDGGASWHVVPGIFGMRSINGGITFSTTTDEAFIGSHNGILVYEYEKFNYYQAILLSFRGEEKLLTVDKSSDGKITLPSFSDYFTASNWVFDGWKHGGTLYPANEEITVE